MVDLSADPLSLGDIGGVGIKSVVSWGSKVGSVTSSVNKLLDIKNMVNIVAEETSYVESGEDNNMDKTTLRKTCIHTYVLGNPPKQPLFNCMSNDNSDLKKAKELDVSEKILVNDEIRKVNSHLDQEVIIKEISVNLPKSAVESLVTANWFVAMGKNFVQVAKAIGDKQSWFSRDQYRALLYTLSVGTTVHDLSGLLDSYGRKICFIGCNPNSYVHDRCAVICFADEASKLAAISSVLVFKGVNLRWTGLSLACCAKCKQFSHISDVCLIGRNSRVCGKWMVTDQDWICLAGIYKKKQVLIACSVSFGGKTWAQVAGGFSSHVASLVFFGAGLSLVAKTSIFASAPLISDILKKLDFIELVPSVVTLDVFPLVVPMSVISSLNMDMVLDGALVISALPP
ncbi:hypothetical protein G9A89_022129 [Geosiphon pyriformis]|nr:hypothetical protein G9A89_022129 [Geosiphon pyriformis]